MFGRKQTLLKFFLGFITGLIYQLCFPKITKDFSIHPLKLINVDLNETKTSGKMLVLIGVMTAKKYLNTRAKAIFETWGEDVPGKIIFFGPEDSKSDFLPLIKLQNVDDSYPPQKKSFSMLKFMFENYAGLFEWYFRADDDLFINTEKLEKFLRSIQSDKAYLIGQTGQGNNEEFGKLKFDANENYCMGGPGIAISSETLLRIGPFLDQCMSNLLTIHEDVELGRCVKQFANISCTWAYDNNQLKMDNFSKVFNEALDNQSSIDLNIIGTEPQLVNHSPKTIEDVPVWDFISGSSYSISKLNPKQRMTLDVCNGLNDIISDVIQSLNIDSKEKGRTINFNELLYAYWRYDPIYGVDVILDLMLTYNKHLGKKMIIPVRRHAYLHRSFQRMRIQEIPLDTNFIENDSNILSIFSSRKARKINFILPLSGRLKTFQRFLKNYEITCIRNNNENCKLIIALFQDEKNPSDFNKVENIVENLKLKYYKKADIIIIRLLNMTFSRSIALKQAVNICKSNDLLLFIDVDIIFNKNALFRIRENTRKKAQVYFPIVFSLYKNYRQSVDVSFYLENKPFAIDDNKGFWRLFGYGIASMFKEDFEQIGGFNNASFTGWGLEDVFLFERFIKHSDIRIFRSADPDLIHVYHEINCDKNLPRTQYEMCLRTKRKNLGSLKQLTNLILKKSNKKR